LVGARAGGAQQVAPVGRLEIEADRLRRGDRAAGVADMLEIAPRVGGASRMRGSQGSDQPLWPSAAATDRAALQPLWPSAAATDRAAPARRRAHRAANLAESSSAGTARNRRALHRASARRAPGRAAAAPRRNTRRSAATRAA